jgi:GrpB-like predicted nucleotidyltransferase (UPF0157 family)
VSAISPDALFAAVTERQLSESVAARYANGYYAVTAPGERGDDQRVYSQTPGAVRLREMLAQNPDRREEYRRRNREAMRLRRAQ